MIGRNNVCYMVYHMIHKRVHIIWWLHIQRETYQCMFKRHTYAGIWCVCLLYMQCWSCRYHYISYIRVGVIMRCSEFEGVQDLVDKAFIWCTHQYCSRCDAGHSPGPSLSFRSPARLAARRAPMARPTPLPQPPEPRGPRWSTTRRPQCDWSAML